MPRKLSEPWSEGEYEAVKARYPNVNFNDEDRTFTAKSGNIKDARMLRNVRPLTREEQQQGNVNKHEDAKNAYKRYLKFLEQGMRISEACKRARIPHQTIRRLRMYDPEFVEAEKRAEEIACEPIENSLYEAARNGNVPAAIKWLEKRAPERWPGDKIQVEQRTTLELNASDHLTNIQMLVARLEQRRELLAETGVIDVEATEPTSPKD